MLFADKYDISMPNQRRQDIVIADELNPSDEPIVNLDQSVYARERGFVSHTSQSADYELSRATRNQLQNEVANRRTKYDEESRQVILRYDAFSLTGFGRARHHYS